MYVDTYIDVDHKIDIYYPVIKKQRKLKKLIKFFFQIDSVKNLINIDTILSFFF